MPMITAAEALKVLQRATGPTHKLCIDAQSVAVVDSGYQRFLCSCGVVFTPLDYFTVLLSDGVTWHAGRDLSKPATLKPAEPIKRITGPRRSGKTMALITACAEQGGYIVVADYSRARDVAERARALGLTIAFPFTFDEFLKGAFHGRNCSPLWIDDADDLLCAIARKNSAVVGGFVFGEVTDARRKAG